MHGGLSIVESRNGVRSRWVRVRFPIFRWDVPATGGEEIYRIDLVGVCILSNALLRECTAAATYFESTIVSITYCNRVERLSDAVDRELENKRCTSL